MFELDDLVKPQWGVERWLEEALDVINDEEKAEVQQRIDKLFANGFPLQIEKRKVLYLHVFSMLTQLEVLAIQVPLKFLSQLKTNESLQARMRQQLVDEIFHTAVFLKITKQLAMPYAFPPSYDRGIEQFCELVVSEPDVKTVVIMLNLIGEGWIEQLFDVLHQAGIAPTVFDAIMEDELRHIEEAELYQALGKPDKDYMQRKLNYIEYELITNVIFKPKNSMALAGLLGVEGCYQLMQQINDTHISQIAKLDLHPHYLWDYFMSHVPEVMEFYHDNRGDKPIPLTPTRKALVAAWDNPKLPTMSCEFSVDISRLGVFDKKYPPETLMVITLQALSRTLSRNLHWCRYMSNDEIFEADAAYVGLVVTLPNHKDHLGMICFRNCHELTLMELGKHIKHDLAIMEYCYETANALKAEHPYLMDIFEEYYREKQDGIFGLPDPATPVVSLSNIGPWGFESAVSPLLPGEACKLTMAKVKKVQEYNHKTGQFDIIDSLPIGVSVDHRIYDANMPVPTEMQKAFKDTIDIFERDLKQPKMPLGEFANLEEYKKYAEQLRKGNLEFAFRSFIVNAHQFANYVGTREPFEEKRKELEALLEKHGDLLPLEED
jgi:hypothetical protein